MPPIARITAASFLLLAAALAVQPLRAGGVSSTLEAGAVWFSRNDVGVPGKGIDKGDRFDLTDLTGTGPSAYGRVYLTYEPSGRDLIRLLVAPLEVTGTGQLSKPVRFRDITFEPATNTKATCKFSTYRITYRRTLYRSNVWRWGLGGAVLVRDAAITLEQGGVKSTESNVGFVPLLHVHGVRRLGRRVSAALDIEGLGAPQGRAIDAAFTLDYRPADRWTLSLGYRTVEGGADNEKVYTFAWLHYLLVSACYHPGLQP
jgi:hypothetical protein